MMEPILNPDQAPAEVRPEDAEGLGCPECGHPEITTFWADRTIPYGIAPDTVEILVRLPVRKCAKCGCQFFDEEAEDLRHDAVCRHLGVLTPAEIRALRKKLGLSRAEFSRLTRLGEATIARWERGELIQNAGNDSLLRLLQHPENVERLRERMPGSAANPPANVNRVFPRAKRENYSAVIPRSYVDPSRN
jgi:putative zinc finger/helix-turn-helix YgiT family protein